MGVSAGVIIWAIFAGVWDWGSVDLFGVLFAKIEMVAVSGVRSVVWGCVRIWAERGAGMDVWDDFLGLFGSAAEYCGANNNSLYAVLGSIGHAAGEVALSVAG